MRVGATAAIALDELLLELSGLEVGDAVRVQWSEDGTLVMTPLGRPPRSRNSPPASDGCPTASTTPHVLMT